MLQMPQARVEHFLRAMKFGAPQITHVVETMVSRVEARIHMGHNQTECRRIDRDWQADRQVKLQIRDFTSPLSSSNHTADGLKEQRSNRLSFSPYQEFTYLLWPTRVPCHLPVRYI